MPTSPPLAPPAAPLLVGRAAELAELVQAWSAVTGDPAATAHGPVTAVITGEAGTGKSLLVATALREHAAADPPPTIVLSGSARLHSPAPYDWLAAVLSAHEPPGLPAPPDALAWLAQHPDAPRQRYTPDALLRMAVRVVRALATPGPAVLVVEDLQALDPASLNLVAEIAAAPGLPALLLVTAQPAADELPARTLARLCGAPGAARQHLGPLDPAGVCELLRRTHPDVTPELAAAVTARTGGNPHRVKELAATGGLAAAAEPATELTAREIEVLGCLANGMSNKQVARSLGISIRTVTVHVSNLLRKTGTASRTEAALWAVSNGSRSAGRR